MVKNGTWLVPDKFEALIIKLYNLSANSNGFGINFNLQVIEKFVQKYLFIESFEALEILKSVEAKRQENDK